MKLYLSILLLLASFSAYAVTLLTLEPRNMTPVVFLGFAIVIDAYLFHKARKIFLVSISSKVILSFIILLVACILGGDIDLP